MNGTEKAWRDVDQMEREYREAYPDDDRSLVEIAEAGDWQRFAESQKGGFKNDITNCKIQR